MGVKVLCEGPARITKATIEAAWKRRQVGVRLVIRDGECRGLALVVNPSAMAWVYSYKPRGTDALTGKRFPSRSVTIGAPASHSPDEARAEASRIKAHLTAGSDPAQDRKAQHKANAERLSMTVERLCDLYGKALPKRPKMRGTGRPGPQYVRDELAHLRLAVEAMKAGKKAVAEVTAADLRRLVSGASDRPSVARHRFGAIARFFDWCLDEGHVATNPTLGFGKAKRPKAPKPRDRFLKPSEVAHLWTAAERMTLPLHRDYLRFLLAVPCRRSEAAGMDWAHVDLDAGTWDQPNKETKNGDPHRFHLPPLALDLLRTRHAAAKRPKAGLVFPGPRKGKPLANFSAMKRELDRLADFSAWVLHDLRRSFATALGEAGIPEAVADAVLNHRQSATRGGVMGVYQRAVRWPERRQAMEAWGTILAAAIENKPQPENVAALADARAKRAQAAG